MISHLRFPKVTKVTLSLLAALILLAPLSFSQTAMGCSGGDVNGQPFAKGDGSVADPFGICTPAQLANTSDPNFAGLNFEILNSLNLVGYTHTPIGTDVAPFTGTFNGNNHSIIGLNINRPTDLNQGFLVSFVGAPRFGI